MKDTKEKKNIKKPPKKNPTQVCKIPGYKALKGKKTTEHKQTTPTEMKTNYLLFNFIFNMPHVYLACGYFPKDM